MREYVSILRAVIGTIGLGCLSVEDIRSRELATAPILAMGLLGAGVSLAGHAWQWPGVLLQFVPGLSALLIARISREGIGYGDGLVILCLGCYLPPPQLAELCMIAITFAGLVALVLLVGRRRGRKETLPFVPFLLAGYLIVLLSGGVE